MQLVLVLCTAPVRNHTHQPLHAREKSPTLTATPLLGHAKTPHTLVGVGSADLVAAVALPRWYIQILPVEIKIVISPGIKLCDLR